MASAVVTIRYTGAQDSCLISTSSSAKTMTSKIGAAGAEAEDPNFGTAGVIDLSAVANLYALVSLIDGYDDYTASLEGEKLGNADNPEAKTDGQAKTAVLEISFTVTTVLDTANALVSWEYARDTLNIGLDYRFEYEQFINAASQAANTETKRKLRARTYTDVYLEGFGCNYLLLPEYPVNAITSLRADSARAFGTETEIEAADYDLDSEAGIVHLLGTTFPDGRKTIRVSYNAGLGYGAEDVPNDLRMAVLEVVEWSRKRFTASGNQLGIRNVRSGDGIITEMEISIPQHVRHVFLRYERAR